MAKCCIIVSYTSYHFEGHASRRAIYKEPLLPLPPSQLHDYHDSVKYPLHVKHDVIGEAQFFFSQKS